MIGNKSYDLVLNGGNIFTEKGKPLNDALARARKYLKLKFFNFYFL